MNNLTHTDKTREAMPAARQCATPSVDVTETKDEYLLEADMPGVNRESLDLLLEGNELTIVGRRQSASVEGTWVHRETAGSDFRRRFVLDPDVDCSRVSAQMEHGVLRVRLPKAEAVKPRRIALSD